MSLRTTIRNLYRENPNISATQIIERLGIIPNKTFWRILNQEQVSVRGVYPGKRRNSRAHNRYRPRGITRWVPPQQRG